MTATFESGQYTVDQLCQDFGITPADIPGKVLFAAWRVDMNECSVNVFGRHQNKLWCVSCSEYDKGPPDETLNDEVPDDRPTFMGLWRPEPCTPSDFEKSVVHALEYQLYYLKRYTLPNHWLNGIE